ncbi:hypothetical protein KIN20_033554 [Parelaphostrongylus tenuis]|uniref:Uncharacterized protein n=1 Tax=Parelaphostrongylus tenuis TaxID=148309 RepID=A0AAD5R872_PARTN|nr:hypothetical protein KIN20_033554 [Parelaphostrongylus tenuis]
MSRDLTCNETLAVEDSERNKESIVRRFPASSSAASAPFRPNYTASVPSVKYTIQKPASKSPFLTTSPAPHIPHPPGSSALLSSDDSSHNQLASAIHTQLQNTNGPKLYKPGNSEYTTSAGVSPSQLQMFAGSALLRNAVAAAGYREDRPSSNSGATLNYASQLQANTMHANIYTTISSMRLQQLQPTQPSPDKSLAAGAFAAVQATTTSRTTVDPLKHGLYHPQAMYKNIVPQSAQQATLLPRATLSPHLANRYAVQNGTKRPSSPKLIRPQSAAHHLIPHQSVAAPNRLIPGHSMAHGTYHVQAAPASPIPSQPVPQIITTSSPRPSILRKRGDGSNASSIAKRRLPFMEETSTPSSTTSQTTVQQGSAGTAPPTL